MLGLLRVACSNHVFHFLQQNQTSSPVKTDVIDSSSSILMLHYDMDLKIAYVAGKVQASLFQFH